MIVLGVGALSEPSIPPVPGIDSFNGTVFHSARWNHDHDLSAERVAVIGTGASAIQFVPRIQPRVGELQLYQRTPPWIMPHPDRPVTNTERALWRAIPRSQHLWRAAVYAARESMVLGLTIEPRLMSAMERVARRHLRSQVPDPALRRKLTPGYRLGCNRILVSNEYFPALCQPNVHVLDGGIEEVRPHSIVARDGTEREVDTIIFGTGFQVTSRPSAQYLRGRDGVEQRDAMAIEVRPEVQWAYNQELQQKLARTVWSSGGCESWYLDASGRNTTLWPSFTFRYRRRTREFDPAEYLLSPAGAPEPVLAGASLKKAA